MEMRSQAKALDAIIFDYRQLCVARHIDLCRTDLMIQQMIKHFSCPTTYQKKFNPHSLHERERLLLQSISDGHTLKSIAKMYHLSESYLGKIRQNILKKMGVHCMAHAIKLALKDRLIT